MEFCLSRCLSLCFSLYLCLWLCLWQQLQLRLRVWLRFVRFFFQAATCLATLRYVTYLCIHTLRMGYNIHTHTHVYILRDANSDANDLSNAPSSPALCCSAALRLTLRLHTLRPPALVFFGLCSLTLLLTLLCVRVRECE